MRSAVAVTSQSTHLPDIIVLGRQQHWHSCVTHGFVDIVGLENEVARLAAGAYLNQVSLHAIFLTFYHRDT